MATNWKNLTDEQKAAINEKRRIKYSQNEEFRQAELQRKAEQYLAMTPEQLQKRRVEQRIPKILKTVTARLSDGTMIPVPNIDPELKAMIIRAAPKVKRHKTAWLKKMARIQAWVNRGSPLPWPNLEDKIKRTWTINLALDRLKRVCSACGKDGCHNLDFAWRVTRKDDPLAFVDSTRLDRFDNVVDHPEEYYLLCVCCANDLRLFAFAWLHHPRTMRDHLDTNPVIPGRLCGPKYPWWDQWLADCYPGDTPLEEKIKQRKIKSLSWTFTGHDGGTIRTFLTVKQYFFRVHETPLQIVPSNVMKQFKETYGEEERKRRGDTPYLQATGQRIYPGPKAGQQNYH